MGLKSIGLEANPFAHFASSVKVNWDIDPEALVAAAREVARSTMTHLQAQGIDDNRPMKRVPGGVCLQTIDVEVATIPELVCGLT